MTKKEHNHESGKDVESDAPPQFPVESAQDEKDQLIEEQQKQIEKLQAEVADATDKMLRFRAEAENMQRRTRIDVENAHKYGFEKLARELLNVVDSLERALEVHKDTEHQQLEAIQEGMGLTYKLLVDTLEKFHIKPINPLGMDFDPKQHEALTIQESNEVGPNKVLTVVQKGFMIHDRILRPARVVVAKAP